MSVSLDDFAPGTSGGVEGVFGRCSSRSLPAAARADRGRGRSHPGSARSCTAAARGIYEEMNPA